MSLESITKEAQDALTALFAEADKTGDGPVFFVSKGDAYGPKPVRLYDIHKCTLPETTEKVVVIGVTKAEGEHLIAHRLKSKLNETQGKEIVTYYRLVPQGGTIAERSRLFNSGPLFTEDKTEPEIAPKWVD